MIEDLRQFDVTRAYENRAFYMALARRFKYNGMDAFGLRAIVGMARHANRELRRAERGQ